MKSFRWKAWCYGKRASVLIVTVVMAVLLLGGGALAFFINGGFGPAASSGSVNLSKGLVGWWKMDGNTEDSSPYANNGTLSGITVVQGPTSATSSNQFSVTASWPAATVTGHTLVAVVTTNNGGTTTTPAGWTLRAGVTNNWGTKVYEITNAASRSGAETFSFSQTEDATLWLLELSGVNTTTPDDVTMTSSGTSLSIPSLGPATMGVNAGMVFAVVDSNDGGPQCGSITTAGWTAASGGYRASMGYQAVNGGQQISATFSTACNWKGVIFSFNAISSNQPSLTTDRKGHASKAYSFNGSNNNIQVGANSSLSNSYLTVSAWVYYKSSSA